MNTRANCICFISAPSFCHPENYECVSLPRVLPVLSLASAHSRCSVNVCLLNEWIMLKVTYWCFTVFSTLWKASGRGREGKGERKDHADVRDFLLREVFYWEGGCLSVLTQLSRSYCSLRACNGDGAVGGTPWFWFQTEADTHIPTSGNRGRSASPRVIKNTMILAEPTGTLNTKPGIIDRCVCGSQRGR